jgi:hypothetical protein
VRQQLLLPHHSSNRSKSSHTNTVEPCLAVCGMLVLSGLAMSVTVIIMPQVSALMQSHPMLPCCAVLCCAVLCCCFNSPGQCCPLHQPLV